MAGTCGECAAELPRAAAWCPACGAAVWSDGDSWDLGPPVHAFVGGRRAIHDETGRAALRGRASHDHLGECIPHEELPACAPGPQLDLEATSPARAAGGSAASSAAPLASRSAGRRRRIMVLLAAAALVAVFVWAVQSLIGQREPPAETRFLFPVHDAGQTAYIDSSGRTVIAGGGYAAQPFSDGFSEGLAATRIEGKSGFIDVSGRLVIPARFDWASDFHEGLVWALREDQWGYIDQTGSFVIHATEYSRGGDFSERLAVVEVLAGHTQLHGYIDQTGALVIPPVFAEAEEFSEGLAAVAVERDGSREWGYIDRDGAWVVEPRFAEARSFSEGLAAVAVDRSLHGWGYIDRTGIWAIEPQFVAAGEFTEGLAAVTRSARLAGDQAGAVYIDKSGAAVLGPFEVAAPFSEGLAAVMPSGGSRWGYVDHAGAWAIQPRFVSAGPFLPGGLALVDLGTGGSTSAVDGGVVRSRYVNSAWSDFQPSDRMAYVDRNGKLVWQSDADDTDVIRLPSASSLAE